jgi:Ser/Thr protein kinase RdoA (MazF antagonist)
MDDSIGLTIDAVLGIYGLGPATSVSFVEGGTLNWNYRAVTGNGQYFVRKHRTELSEERIREEHNLLLWAYDRGIPVARPSSTTIGDSVARYQGRLWAVFPWIEGRTITRGEASPREAAALGEIHGLMHSVLAAHPSSAGARFDMQWDKHESEQTLAAIALAAERGHAEHSVQAAIALQRKLLSETEVQPPSAFDWLPAQLVHGDFHDQQVLFDGTGRVAAVVDWELFRPLPRIWELIRSLNFAGLFGNSLLEDYMSGYRHYVSLSEDECRAGLQLWWQSRVVGAWVWAAYFLQGNERVRPLFPATVQALNDISSPEWQEKQRNLFLEAALG